MSHLGRVVEKVKPVQMQSGGKHAKQIVEVLRHIALIAAEEGAQAKPMWLPPLPAVIDCNELIRKYGYTGDSGFVLNPAVGELDDPYHQRQDILTVPLTEKGNVLVYGNAGSGKIHFSPRFCTPCTEAMTAVNYTPIYWISVRRRSSVLPMHRRRAR